MSQFEVAFLRAGIVYMLVERIRSAAENLDSWLQSRDRATALRQRLNAMSDHELRDIGLTRFDIETVATGGRPRA